MVRDSRSPPPREPYQHRSRSDRGRRQEYENDSRRRNSYRDSGRDDRGSKEERRNGDNPYRNSRRNSRERDAGRRERELGRDRGHDDRDRPSTSRRSASPPRRSRSQSHRDDRDNRSKSGSPNPVDKAKPNFNPSGLLAAATKTVKHADGTGTVLKYHEPPEARKPVVGWRLYVFKGKEQVGECNNHS